jgi:cytochrome P450
MAMVVLLLTLGMAESVERQRWHYRMIGSTGPTLRLPNHEFNGDVVKTLFRHPDLGKKKSSGLRQLIQWWHAPCAECHQEIMEPNALHQQLRPVTAHLLARPADTARSLIRSHLEAAIQRQTTSDGWSVKRLRSMLAPVTVAFTYEYLFGRRCTDDVLRLLTASVFDVIATTGSLKRPNMPIRQRALRHVADLLEAEGGRADIFGTDCTLSIAQRAQYLLGVWFHTGATHLFRLACNSISLLCRDPRHVALVREERASGQDTGFTDAVLLEALRLFPGVPSTDRVATRDITLPNGRQIPAGTNVVFDVTAFQGSGFKWPRAFMPLRWAEVDPITANYMPFGVGKRRCPAERHTFDIAREVVMHMVSSLDIHTPSVFRLLYFTEAQMANAQFCMARSASVRPGFRLHCLRAMLSAVLVLDNLRIGLMQLRVMPLNARDAFLHDKLDQGRPPSNAST